MRAPYQQPISSQTSSARHPGGTGKKRQIIDIQLFEKLFIFTLPFLPPPRRLYKINFCIWYIFLLLQIQFY